MARRKGPRRQPRRLPPKRTRIIRRDRFGRFNARGQTIQRVPVRGARKPPKRRPKPRPRLPRPTVVKPPPGAVSLVDAVHPLGRFAFLARDQRPDVADTFVGRARPVEARLVFAYTDPLKGVTFDVERIISFEPGEDDEDFWDNYHQAVRDALDDISEGAERETSGRYSRFGVAVTHFA